MVETGREIYYEDIINLGFSKQIISDSVFEKQQGYMYQIITLKLNNYLEIDWDMVTMEASLINFDEDGSINAKYAIKDLEELKLIIKMVKKYG